MNLNDFQQIEQGHQQVLRAALEVATADANLAGYAFQGDSIQVNEDEHRELSDEEETIIARFREESRFQVEAVVRQSANEGFLDTIAETGLKQVMYEITATMSRVRNAVKIYTQQSQRMGNTLKKCLTELKNTNPRDKFFMEFEMGPYSRFFSLGDFPCNTLDQFLVSIYAHRTTSDWCAQHTVPAISDIYNNAEKTVLALHKSTPHLTAAIAESSVDRAAQVVLRHCSEDLRMPMTVRGIVRGSPEVPQPLRGSKDFRAVGKGVLFDASVLCVVEPTKGNKRPSWGALIVRNEAAKRPTTKSYEFDKVEQLISLVEHGIEIASNTEATLKDLDKVVTRVLAPLEESILVLTKRMRLRDMREKNYMFAHAHIAKMLCSVSVNPLLSSTWLDLRLIRMIAAMTEVHFVKDPSKRMALKQEQAQA